MIYHQLWTKHYQHEYLFTFKGEKYFVHSIVELTKKGKMHLEVSNQQVILTEHFIGPNGKECWTYEVGWAYGANKPRRISTDCHPNKLIEKIVIPASEDYAEREIFGIHASSYTNGIKHTKKDWEIVEVRNAWIYFFLVCFGALIFKDWYVKIIIIGAAGWFLGIYRQAYVNAYTTYTHEEDNEILKKKYEIIYGATFNKEDNNE